MNILTNIFLVLFIIAAVLLVLIVLIQNDEGDSLGGIFAGGSSSAFGSRSGNVLTKATSILGGVFLVLSLALAIVNRTPGVSGVEKAGRQNMSTEGSTWYLNEDTPGVEIEETTGDTESSDTAE